MYGRREAEIKTFVRGGSARDIAIERALGKLEVPDVLEGAIRMQGFEFLPTTFHHAAQAGNLLPLHGDPFDRMLIAQAQAERFVLVTRDS